MKIQQKNNIKSVVYCIDSLLLMLGYMCGKRNLISVCIIGILIQEMFVCLSDVYILPSLEHIYSGTLIAFAQFAFILLLSLKF